MCARGLLSYISHCRRTFDLSSGFLTVVFTNAPKRVTHHRLRPRGALILLLPLLTVRVANGYCLTETPTISPETLSLSARHVQIPSQRAHHHVGNRLRGVHIFVVRLAILDRAPHVRFPLSDRAVAVQQRALSPAARNKPRRSQQHFCATSLVARCVHAVITLVPVCAARLRVLQTLSERARKRPHILLARKSWI